jgi:hypothetical protein
MHCKIGKKPVYITSAVEEVQLHDDNYILSWREGGKTEYTAVQNFSRDEQLHWSPFLCQ